jgi:hypothetical protein
VNTGQKFSAASWICHRCSIKAEVKTEVKAEVKTESGDSVDNPTKKRAYTRHQVANLPKVTNAYWFTDICNYKYL